jgi:hypothetical protein
MGTHRTWTPDTVLPDGTPAQIRAHRRAGAAGLETWCSPLDLDLRQLTSGSGDRPAFPG